MAQFDVYAEAGSRALLVDCQTVFLADLPTRFVVPLIPVKANPPRTSRLNPHFEVDGTLYVFSPNAAFTIRARELTKPLASLAAEQEMVRDALDMLMIGF